MRLEGSEVTLKQGISLDKGKDRELVTKYRLLQPETFVLTTNREKQKERETERGRKEGCARVHSRAQKLHGSTKTTGKKTPGFTKFYVIWVDSA